MLFFYFNRMLERETEQGKRENLLFQTIYDMVYQNMEKYGAEFAGIQAGNSATERMTNQNGTECMILETDGTITLEGSLKLPQDEIRSLAEEMIRTMDPGADQVYGVRKVGTRYYLLSIITDQATDSADMVYLGILKDLSGIYEERSNMMRQYGIALAGLLVIGGLAAFLLSRYLTRPIEQLNRTAGRIAEGNLEKRAAYQGADEIGELSYAYFKADELGEQRIDLIYNKVERTHATILVVSNYETLIDKRVNFIIDHQQMNDSQDARYGAYMVYDNEKQAIYKNDDKRKSYDCDEGRERVGMGILIAKWYMKHPSEKLKQSLIRYAKFYHEKLQTEDFTTYSRVTKDGWNRGYNYAWAADFFFHMYEITQDKQYALWGYKTMQALYHHTGYGFYCIDIPVTTGLKALKKAGMMAEYNDLLIDFSKTADVFMRNGLRFPKSEVNYEQSIVAPATQFLLEMYLQTKDTQYLKGAEKMMPLVENLCGTQPDYRLNEIPIRHWDCYWFGKRRVFGDTFPHYWTCINANAYYYYAKATGKEQYMKMAKEIVRNNLCNVFENGTGSCAFVYPKRINGEKAHFADAFANDQDWALAYYLMVNE